jgi:hypothetical protein
MKGLDPNGTLTTHGEAELRRRLDLSARRPTLKDVHAVFRRWLGDEYDIDTANAVLATAAAERLRGDPLWLLVVSGPGNAKTETVSALSAVNGAIMTSTIASEGALLSASSKRDKVKGATGGLLRRIGERGLLLVKDFTSVLSAGRDLRGPVLAAMREVFDGAWERSVGSDGGQSLAWQGRIAVIGAVTTAWDTHHSVVATLGDRFVLVRADSRQGRLAAGRRAIRNTGSEAEMRKELADAVRRLIDDVDPGQSIALTDEEADRILRAADLVTLIRTGVEFDQRGEVIDAHAPEMPTRFAKQLGQLVRGGIAIGMQRKDALALAIRCAKDSMPPLRLEIMQDLSKHPESLTLGIARRLNKPRSTVRRQVQALNLLGVLQIRVEERQGRDDTYYRIADGVSLESLVCPKKSATHTSTN